MLVMDRVVAEPALQLGEVVVAEGREARRVHEHDEAVVVDDPDRLGDGLEDRLHRGDGLDLSNRRFPRRLGLVHGGAGRRDEARAEPARAGRARLPRCPDPVPSPKMRHGRAPSPWPRCSRQRSRPPRPRRAHAAPRLTGVRCVPATPAACHAGRGPDRPPDPAARQRLLARHARAFRWSRGALATKLRRGGAGWDARVPAGTRAGTVTVRVRDRAGRRSRREAFVVAAGRRSRAPRVRGGRAAGGLPRQRHVDLAAAEDRGRRPRRDRRAGARRRHRRRSSSRRRRQQRWASSRRRSSPALHARGLRVCAWQYVYGADPLAEAAAGRATRSPTARTASSSTPRPRTRAATPRRSLHRTRCAPRSARAIRSA